MIAKNMLAVIGNTPLNEVVADWQEVILSPEEDVWMEFPPKDFLNFVLAYPETPFDFIPPSDNYKKPPSFLIAQAHRLWQTTSRVYDELSRMDAKRFIDLGSFPFFLPFILRDYFKFKGEIIVTTNIDLTNEQNEFMDKKGIVTMKLDLDPYVNDPADASPRLPFWLSLPDESTDFILASHVIEHLYHPRLLVKESLRLLRDGGKLMISTDNAMMVDVFANYIGGYGYTFEPIEQTAAMTFHFWRGHVRFYTERDLSKLVEAEGFKVANVEFFHCFYEVFFDDYFNQFNPRIGGWKRKLLRDHPWLRNDIAILAVK